ncbi:DUF1987 domain-containing protein [Nafulsella turpanensis]|uniref:DUF1987 domain-containing protein n=1 Tax=Nafulsella turpanensis TaxID=1265690 RepID=UPI00034C9526|nr:DUF1987 domain-containing protein [Nafulsella turpanensis]
MTAFTIAKNIELEKKADTPMVNFLAQEGLLELRGRSLPENAESFYRPLLDWVSGYVSIAPGRTVFSLDLEYFNSSSVKQVLSLLIKLEELTAAGKEVEIIWKYNEDDELMEMKGRELASIVELPFRMESYSL